MPVRGEGGDTGRMSPAPEPPDATPHTGCTPQALKGVDGRFDHLKGCQ